MSAQDIYLEEKWKEDSKKLWEELHYCQKQISEACGTLEPSFSGVDSEKRRGSWVLGCYSQGFI